MTSPDYSATRDHAQALAYRTCACEHCPEIAIGAAGAICGECEAAGCTADGCEREDEIFAEFFPEEVTP